MGGWIDRDLADPEWRRIFQAALRSTPRFRRGFAEHGEDAAGFGSLLDQRWETDPMSLAEVRRMSCHKLDPERALAFEYGLMLVKTSAALWYTIRLCQRAVEIDPDYAQAWALIALAQVSMYFYFGVGCEDALTAAVGAAVGLSFRTTTCGPQWAPSSGWATLFVPVSLTPIPLRSCRAVSIAPDTYRRWLD